MADELTDAVIAEEFDRWAHDRGGPLGLTPKERDMLRKAARRLRTPPTPDLSAEASAKEIAREIGQAIWKSQRLSGEPHGIWLDEAVAAVLPALARVRQETEERCLTVIANFSATAGEHAVRGVRPLLAEITAAIRAGSKQP